MELPRNAISIMQPWAWLIANGHKDIENRSWMTRFRGPVAIHAGRKIDSIAQFYLEDGRNPVTGTRLRFTAPRHYDTGGIVGVAEIVGCVQRSSSPWFVGEFGFVLDHARPVDFIPVKGALGFFDWRENLSTKPAPAQAQGALF